MSENSDNDRMMDAYAASGEGGRLIPLCKEREERIMSRLLRSHVDKSSSFPELVGGIAAIHELRGLQDDLNRVINKVESKETKDG